MTDPAELWQRATALAESRGGPLASLTPHLKLTSIDHGQARLELSDPDQRFAVERALPKIAELITGAGGPVVTPALSIAKNANATASPTRTRAADRSLIDAAKNDPAVRAAIDVLQARVEDVIDDPE